MSLADWDPALKWLEEHGAPAWCVKLRRRQLQDQERQQQEREQAGYPEREEAPVNWPTHVCLNAACGGTKYSRATLHRTRCPKCGDWMRRLDPVELDRLGIMIPAQVFELRRDTTPPRGTDV